jgi:hypothetical protein
MEEVTVCMPSKEDSREMNHPHLELGLPASRSMRK